MNPLEETYAGKYFARRISKITESDELMLIFERFITRPCILTDCEIIRYFEEQYGELVSPYIKDASKVKIIRHLSKIEDHSKYWLGLVYTGKNQTKYSLMNNEHFFKGH